MDRKILARIFVIAALFVGFLNFSFVEAKADIHFRTTGVTLRPGKAIVRGYFYNDGNSAGLVTSFRIWGYVGKYSLDSTFSGSNVTVGSIAAYGRKDWNFVITKRTISSSDSNPKYNFKSAVSFR